MRWPWTKPKPRLVDPLIDSERDSLPMGSDPDPLSLAFDIAMHGDVVTMAMDQETGEWVVVAGDRTWARPTQMEALLAARDELRAGP